MERLPNEVIVLGYINTHKAIHDTDRVLHLGGVSRTVKATDYKNPIRVLVYDEQSTTGWLGSQSDSQ